MLKKCTLSILFLLLIISKTGFSQQREIAITIDDLPFVGESGNFHLNMIIEAIKADEIPATGFVIADKIRPDNWEVLHKFHDAGLGLGNHTLTHANLNQINADAYIREIDEADKILLPLLTEPKFFRYPYLAMSEGSKKMRVMDFLSTKKYQIAPITIDSKDFIFNQLLLSVPESGRRSFLDALRTCYLEYIWQQTLQAEEKNRFNHKNDQAQILLIHANLLNAYVLPDIIKLYKQNGFRFVNLETALKSIENGDSKKIAKKKANRVELAIKNFMDWD